MKFYTTKGSTSPLSGPNDIDIMVRLYDGRELPVAFGRRPDKAEEVVNILNAQLNYEKMQCCGGCACKS